MLQSSTFTFIFRLEPHLEAICPSCRYIKQYINESILTALKVMNMNVCIFCSLSDPNYFFHSPMSEVHSHSLSSRTSYFTQNKYQREDRRDRHLSKSKPKLTANVEMQMEQQIKTQFSFFPRPLLGFLIKSASIFKILNSTYFTSKEF